MTIKRLVSLSLFVIAPVGIIVLGIVGMFVMAAMKPAPKEKDEPPLSLAVFTAPAAISDVSLSVHAQGVVKPKRQVEISSQVAGRITYVFPNMENGGMVKQGEVLIRLEDADYKLAKVRAESAVASAQQTLETVEAEAAIARQELNELGIENPSPLALREPQLAEARASLAAAEAQASDAALQLARTEVRAPFDALVQEKNVELGKYVGPGSPIGTIFAKNVVEVELAIPNDDLGNLGLPIAFNATKSNPGPTVTMTADVGGKQRTWTGYVTRTGAAVDSKTRLVSVFVEVQDPFGKGSAEGTPLAPGLFVTAKIEGRSMSNVIRTPRSALRGTDKVYVIYEEPEPEDERTKRLEAEKESKIAEVTKIADQAKSVLGVEIDKDAVPNATKKIEDEFTEKLKKHEEAVKAAANDNAKLSDDDKPKMIQFLEIRTVDVLRTTSEYAYFTSGISDDEQVIISPVQAAMTGMRVRVVSDAETGKSDAQDDTLKMAADTAVGAN